MCFLVLWMFQLAKMNYLEMNKWIFLLVVVCKDIDSEEGLCSKLERTRYKDKLIYFKTLFCCDNYERVLDAQCRACAVGFTSIGGSHCQPCVNPKYGFRCADTCLCTTDQRCDNVKGCIDKVDQLEAKTMSFVSAEITSGQSLCKNKGNYTMEKTLFTTGKANSPTRKEVTVVKSEIQTPSETTQVTLVYVPEKGYFTKDTITYAVSIGVTLCIMTFWCIFWHHCKKRKKAKTNLISSVSTAAKSASDQSNVRVNSESMPNIDDRSMYEEINEAKMCIQIEVLNVQAEVKNVSESSSSSTEDSDGDNLIDDQHHSNIYLSLIPGTCNVNGTNSNNLKLDMTEKQYFRLSTPITKEENADCNSYIDPDETYLEACFETDSVQGDLTEELNDSCVKFDNIEIFEYEEDISLR